nr:MAG TPA: triphosphate pyrophosphohydrolase [Caudoviricetes sp.]
MRHGGQRSRRFMRRLMERMAEKQLIAMGRQAQQRKGAFDVDMTKPQPCVKAKEQTDADFAMKLAEEVQEVTEAMKALDCATRELAYCRYARRLARDRLGEELTDVITVCTTWLASLGYDEVERGRIQRAVNDKNRRRGYWG